MPPAKVADAVHDAVVSQQLYILTHESSRAALSKRVGHIVAGENPTVSQGDIQNLLN